MIEQCQNCKYWITFKGKQDKGRCRRYSPEVLPDISGFLTLLFTYNATAWPETAYDDWCGEYELKAEEKPEKP